MENENSNLNVFEFLIYTSDKFCVPTLFIQLTGDIRAGLFLARCLELTIDGNGSFFRSAKEWQEELLISHRVVENMRKKLSRWLQTTVRKNSEGDPTTYYTINVEQIFIDIQEIRKKRGRPLFPKGKNHLTSTLGHLTDP
jgi:hypothetical protein